MRSVLRWTTLFLVACLAMAVAFGSGFATAGRMDGASALDLTRLVVPGAAEAPPEGAAAAVDGGAPAGAAVDGTGSPSGASADGADGAAEGFEVYWDAWRTVMTAYDGELPDGNQLTYESIRGSLRALEDPYTLFTDPVVNAVQSVELDGEFEGIGAYVQNNDSGQLVVQTPMRGQPAERAGVEAGDIVLAVDDTDLTDMDINEAVLLIRGPKGTVVRLTIQREGLAEPFDIEVTRDTIDIPSVNDVRLLTDEGAPDVGYMQVTVFAAETRAELVDALRELKDGGAKAIVLDLRNNPGGYLNAAVGVVSEFVPRGVVTIREDSQGRRFEEKVEGGGTAYDIPLVILVNQGSASASEIVAGAIHDFDRGVLVGETTFGKGSVQNVHDISDGSQLRVTVEIWRTPSGSLIHKRGITPDVVVTPVPAAPVAAEDDDAGDPATAAATATPAPGAAPSEGASDDAGDAGAAPERPDNQLERAIEEARRLIEEAA